jgi:septal ring factor EnvC (AmiA/AmiB activator)
MRHLISLVLLASLATGTGAASAASGNPEAELGQLKQRIAELQGSVRDDLARRDRLSASLREAEEQVAAASHRLDEVRAKIRASDARISSLGDDRRQQQHQLDTQREELAGQLRAAYMNGQEEQLKLLLSQKDPAMFGRMLVYYSYFGRARAGQIAQIRQAVERIDALAQDEQEERQRLASLEQDGEHELASLDEARAGRKQALAAVQGQIRSSKDEIERLKGQAQALDKLIRDLRSALSRAPAPAGLPFGTVRGRLPWPVPGRIVANFGQSRGGGLKWTGVLIATERGTEVQAPYAGRVVYADWLPGLGLLLIIDHGGGYMTLYGHNEQLYKGVGENVAAGEVIATVGDSGGQARPELYLEVRKGTTPQDPKDWFRGGRR